MSKTMAQVFDEIIPARQQIIERWCLFFCLKFFLTSYQQRSKLLSSEQLKEKASWSGAAKVEVGLATNT